MWSDHEYDDDAYEEYMICRSELPKPDFRTGATMCHSKNLNRLGMIPWFTSGFT